VPSGSTTLSGGQQTRMVALITRGVQGQHMRRRTDEPGEVTNAQPLGPLQQMRGMGVARGVYCMQALACKRRTYNVRQRQQKGRSWSAPTGTHCKCGELCG
jgi:hypothetical protein